MSKKYTIEFTLIDNSKQILEIETDDLARTVLEWSRNRPVKSHKVLESNSIKKKNLLLG